MYEANIILDRLTDVDRFVGPQISTFIPIVDLHYKKSFCTKNSFILNNVRQIDCVNKVIHLLHMISFLKRLHSTS